MCVIDWAVQLDLGRLHETQTELESALARPRSGYYSSISEQAAAMLHSLAGNHAFIDGNKRVAFAATAVFLRMNGYALMVDAGEAERFLIDDVIKGRAEVAVITDWLERFLVPTST